MSLSRSETSDAQRQTQAFLIFSLQKVPSHLSRLHGSLSTAQTSGENVCANLGLAVLCSRAKQRSRYTFNSLHCLATARNAAAVDYSPVSEEFTGQGA